MESAVMNVLFTGLLEFSIFGYPMVTCNYYKHQTYPVDSPSYIFHNRSVLKRNHSRFTSYHLTSWCLLLDWCWHLRLQWRRPVRDVYTLAPVRRVLSIFKEPQWDQSEGIRIQTHSVFCIEKDRRPLNTQGLFYFKAQDPGAWDQAFLANVRRHLRLRYKLLPYMYTLFKDAHTIGTTVVRPLMFEYVCVVIEY